MNLAYIALGGNLEDPLSQVTRAVAALSNLGRVTACSSWYLSKAIGPGENPATPQPDYINGVAALETSLTARNLLAALQQIENEQGRVRTIRWGARTLDLDILLFNFDCIAEERLVIPHPRLAERNFVVYPLYEIAPDLVLPGGHRLADLYNRLTGEGLEKLPQNS